MKRIDVVELYVRKRIELLERANGEYKINQNAINELIDVIDVINKVNYVKRKQEDEELGFLSDTLDKIDKCLSKAEEVEN